MTPIWSSKNAAMLLISIILGTSKTRAAAAMIPIAITLVTMCTM